MTASMRLQGASSAICSRERREARATAAVAVAEPPWTLLPSLGCLPAWQPTAASETTCQAAYACSWARNSPPAAALAILLGVAVPHSLETHPGCCLLPSKREVGSELPANGRTQGARWGLQQQERWLDDGLVVCRSLWPRTWVAGTLSRCLLQRGPNQRGQRPKQLSANASRP